MAKSQETKKVAMKEKTTKVKPVGLSEDRVVDSDSEGEQKARESAAKPVAKAKEPEKKVVKAREVEKTKKPKSKEVNGEKEKEKKKTASPAKKAASPPPPPPPKVVSSEDSDDLDSDDLDSDDESSASANETKEVPTKKAVNGVKRKASEASGSEEESGSGSDSDESLAEVQPAAKKSKTSQQQPEPSKKPAASASESEEEAPAVESITSVPVPSKPFVAPEDFTPLDPSTSHSTFPSNLSGKQIWHITAPSSLPISEITNVGLDAIANGSTVLTHKGCAYTLAEDTSTSSTIFSVLLPGNEGYKLLEQPVEKTLRMRQKIELPNLTAKQASTATGSAAAADVWRTGKVDGEDVRPQPKGMRMRYIPPGFGLGNPGLGSDDDEEQVEGFRLPGKKAKKSRRESGEAMEGVEKTGKELSKEERKRLKKEAKAKAASSSQ